MTSILFTYWVFWITIKIHGNTLIWYLYKILFNFHAKSRYYFLKYRVEKVKNSRTVSRSPLMIGFRFLYGLRGSGTDRHRHEPIFRLEISGPECFWLTDLGDGGGHN
jgi:hypothetical protein